MLSRIQTLLLLLAAGAIAVSFIFPVVYATIGEIKMEYTNYGLYVYEEKGRILAQGGFIYLVAAAVLLFLLVALSQFKKRTLQVKICRLTYVVILVQFALCFFIPENTITEIKLAGEVKIQYGVSFFIPLVALVFTFLAERAIIKDERLVRSADRLR